MDEMKDSVPGQQARDEKLTHARHESGSLTSNGTSGAMTFIRLAVLIALVFFSFAMGTIPANERNGTAELFAPLFFVAAPALYFLPTIEGAIRKQPNQTSIAIVNIFLGWTLVGWVVAMAWACKSAVPEVAAKAFSRPSPMTAPTGIASTADELAKLASLKAQGLLTEEEFNQQKAKLLA